MGNVVTGAAKRKTGIAFLAAVLAVAIGGYFWHQNHTPEALMDRGQALQMRGLFKEAVPLFREAAQRSPKDPLAHEHYGYALMSVNNVMINYPATAHSPATTAEDANEPPPNQLHQAISQYSTAVQLAPQDMGYHFSLAGALDMADETEAAIAEWRKTLALLPRTPTRIIAPQVQTDNAQTLSGVYQSLADDLAKTGAIAEADQDYQAALRWEPTYDYLRLDYANFLNQHGRRSEARVQWQKIVTQNHYEASKAKAMLATYPEQS